MGSRHRTGAARHWLVPGARRHGIGRALLANHHQHVDQIGHPIDTAVATITARNYLTGQGYHPGTPLRLHGGPRLWPLRRASRPIPPTTVAG
ncbi:hypothetical protein ACQPYA_00215 [Micromonospora sp. CA-263727]|uniref:hypothetical protein n=1 Tax=Micromonospora sp. CA-263727 TaxID=3239967 RepID=UPI003D91FABB